MALVLWAIFVFLNAELLVGLADGEDEEQGMGGAWDKGEQFRFVYAENIVERELLGEAQIVDQGGHDVGVVLWRPTLAGRKRARREDRHTEGDEPLPRGRHVRRRFVSHVELWCWVDTAWWGWVVDVGALIRGVYAAGSK